MTFDRGDRRAKAVRNSRKLENTVTLWELGEELDHMSLPGTYRGRPYDADEAAEQETEDQ